MIHGPSLAIGAGIASISIIIAFLALDGIMDEPKLTLEQPSGTQETTSTNIVSNTFTANGSPILGDPNAPITLIEFGDYQCHFCNV
ncbi:MAG: DsbA family protein, partial [Nitrosopumilus sp.]|nr:DsbA family protein [Nitrosopumilus sp.]